MQVKPEEENSAISNRRGCGAYVVVWECTQARLDSALPHTPLVSSWTRFLRYVHAGRDRGVGLAAPNSHRARPTATGGWRHRGRRNGNRGGVFRRFLIDAFGLDALKLGSGVRGRFINPLWVP